MERWRAQKAAERGPEPAGQQLDPPPHP
jgi:hypothetical protein